MKYATFKGEFKMLLFNLQLTCLAFCMASNCLFDDVKTHYDLSPSLTMLVILLPIF